MNADMVTTVVLATEDPRTPQAYARLLRHEHSSPHSDIPPERRLMVAMMRDAIRCIDRYRDARDSRRRRLFQDDAKWVLSNDRSWVHSFVRICEALDLNAADVRRSLGLSHGKKRERATPRAAIATTSPRARRPSC